MFSYLWKEGKLISPVQRYWHKGGRNWMWAQSTRKSRTGQEKKKGRATENKTLKKSEQINDAGEKHWEQQQRWVYKQSLSIVFSIQTQKLLTEAADWWLSTPCLCKATHGVHINSADACLFSQLPLEVHCLHCWDVTGPSTQYSSSVPHVCTMSFYFMFFAWKHGCDQIYIYSKRLREINLSKWFQLEGSDSHRCEHTHVFVLYEHI